MKSVHCQICIDKKTLLGAKKIKFKYNFRLVVEIGIGIEIEIEQHNDKQLPKENAFCYTWAQTIISFSLFF